MTLIQPRSSTVSSMAMGPMPPWRNEDEAEDYAIDPRAFLLDRCSIWLPSYHLMHNLVLCATYYLPLFDILPNGTKFYRADKTQDEAVWQGKVGLVLTKGPIAFVDEPQAAVFFHGQDVAPGDWVQWNIHDAKQETIDRVSCRYLKDTQIVAKVDDPRLIY